VSDSASAQSMNRLAALLRGETVSWTSVGMPATEWLRACVLHAAAGLVYNRLDRFPLDNEWPGEVRDELARVGREEAARELVLQREIRAVLAALGREGVSPVLLKGTALAYTVYEEPAFRPRNDTDLLVPREQVEIVRRVMARLGYTAPNYCDGELVFGQFEVGRQDALGVEHTFDFHWKISTQSTFADVLDYAELATEAVPVHDLGSYARAAGPVHALVLACIHPVMHHRNVVRFIWVYDVHLLMSQLSDRETRRFVRIARSKRIAAICAHQLGLARDWFDTPVPNHVIAPLAAATGEPSADYLRSGRRWHDELVSSIRGFPLWRNRLRLLREVLFPGAGYMLASYGMKRGPVGAALLPALYADRIVRGGWKVLTARK
jgi:hypothetical protein